MSITNSELDEFVEEIERIDGERAELLEARNKVLKEAETAGYSKPVLRKVVERRRKARKDVLAFDQQLADFEAELGMDVTE